MVAFLPMIAAFLGASILSDEDDRRPLYHLIFKWNDGAFIARLIKPFDRIEVIAPIICKVMGISDPAWGAPQKRVGGRYDRQVLSLFQMDRAFLYHDGVNYIVFAFIYGADHTFFMPIHYSTNGAEVIGQRICWLLREYIEDGEFSLNMSSDLEVIGIKSLQYDCSAEDIESHRQLQRRLSLLGAPDQVDPYEATIYQTNDTPHSLFMMPGADFMATIGVESAE